MQSKDQFNPQVAEKHKDKSRNIQKPIHTKLPNPQENQDSIQKQNHNSVKASNATNRSTSNENQSPQISPSTESGKWKKTKKFRCIECGTPVSHIYHTTRQGRLTLSTCTQCSLTCDKYVEYDSAILLLDLLLHKKQAIRHLLFNYHHKIENGLSINNSKFASDTWRFSKIALCSVVLRACIYFNNSMGYMNVLSHTKDSVPIFYQFLFKSFLEMVIYILILLCLGGIFATRFVRLKYLFMCILLSSFVNLGFAPMLIWEYSKLFQASIIILHWSMTVLCCHVVADKSSLTSIGIIVGVSMLLAHLCVWWDDSPIKIAHWGELK